MKVTVVGAGALGGYFGLRLLEAGNDVNFLVRERRGGQLEEEGLGLISPYGDYKADHLQIYTNADQIKECDLVFLSVKGYHLQGVLPQLKILAAKGAYILPVLNGIEHLSILQEACGEDKVLGGLAFIIATLDDKGHVCHTSSQHDFIIGGLDEKQRAVCDRLAKAAEQANINVAVSATILTELWKKYTFITAFSGITTASRLTIGPIRENEALTNLSIEVLQEMTQLAKAYHVDLTDIMPQAGAEQIKSFPDEATSSMHQDFRKGLPLEVDHLLGGALRLANKRSLKIPHIETIHALLKPYEHGRQERTAIDI
ncbi:ketopantoate reductase [Scopulibacillus darangshiensis]|uniref:2-dehydropantoate 2-reductase n=1 Tax=Scopulibacillus darangshiensis TaxID=442528 RepID=A0A4R2NN10_9BACL|nr:ketopantoate reductase family protein [Scopulibacillus darangshiensis]TCP23027.1 ketopantoate reductase [Scopulibacillus darangshiensis]